MIADRYSLDREIGRGGSGPVWLATDETLQRTVAMKRIGMLPGVDEVDRARAEREAQISAAMHHANVVQVHDVVVADDGVTHWLVMEYVEGPSLAGWVKEHGPLTPAQARPVLAQVASALLAAHAADVVHRDVKPSNVLIDPDGTAKLTDFGIARLGTDPALTQTGLLTGSPSYLSPEVAAGGPGDERSDVWALGATAFHMLSGRPPYEVDGNVLGTLYKIVHDEVPRLDDAGELHDLLLGTMTKDPDQRWSMQQVVDFLADDPVPASFVPSIATTGLTPGPVALTPADEGTQVLAAPAPHPTVTRGAPATPAGRSGPPYRWWAVALGLVIALAIGVGLVRAMGEDDKTPPTASQQPTATTSEKADQPTAEGMEQFVRDYVERIGENPATSWPMLTASFQNKSGGFSQYAGFWEGARDPQISNIEADPESLIVTYDVRWKGHSNGPRTRLLLAFEDGRYLIDDEITKGFTPTG